MRGLIVLLIILMFPYCSGDQRSLPSESEIMNLFDENGSSTSQKLPSISEFSPNIKVYVDGSFSMTGFLRIDRKQVGGTSYCSLLINLDAYLRGRDETLNYYKFGTTISEIRNINSAIRDLSFYNQTQTRLAQLISNFSKVENPPKSLIIITDGIQSTPDGQDFRETVSSLSNCISEGFYFGILKFESEFNGDVFSETRGGERLGWYGSDEYGARPFYIYILSPLEEYGRQLHDELKSYIENSSIYYFNIISEILDPSHISFKGTRKTFQNEPNFVSNYATKANIKYLFWKKNKRPQLSGDIIVSIKLNLKPGAKNFILGNGNIRSKIEATTFDSKTIISKPLVSIISTEFKKNKLELHLHLKELIKEEWVIYRITLKPGAGIISPPEWVKELSLNKDIALEDFSKTLYFKDFLLSVMQNSRLSEQKLAEFYLAVKGRKK